MKIPVDELEKGLKEQGRKNKYEVFLDENRESLIEMLNKGYSVQDVSKAINIYLAKINRMRRDAKKNEGKVPEKYENLPAMIPKKVISKYVKKLRDELREQKPETKPEQERGRNDSKAEVESKSSSNKKNESSVNSNGDKESKDIITDRKTEKFNVD